MTVERRYCNGQVVVVWWSVWSCCGGGWSDIDLQVELDAHETRRLITHRRRAEETRTPQTSPTRSGNARYWWQQKRSDLFFHLRLTRAHPRSSAALYMKALRVLWFGLFTRIQDRHCPASRLFGELASGSGRYIWTE